MNAYHERLLDRARRYIDADKAVPIDLEAAIAAAGLSLEPLHSCKDFDTNG